jgi:hypothetical protein
MSEPGDLMDAYVRIGLPREVAADMIHSQDAVPHLSVRGGASDVVMFAVDSINTGSAVVTLAVTANACRRLVASAIRRRDSEGSDQVRISVAVRGAEKSFEVDRNSPDAVEKACLFVMDQINGAG